MNHFIMLFRALFFYIGLAVATVIMCTILFIIYPLPFAVRYYVATRWAVFVLWWLKITCRLKHSVHGLENIPASASIIMSKHQSAWEAIALQLIFPRQTWVLKRELFWVPIYGWALASLHPIAIDRRSVREALREVVKRGCERLAEDTWVVLFPESTRLAPGQTKKYQSGGAMVAEKSGALIVPVAHNAGCFWPRNSFTKKPGTVQVVIGPPIDPKGKTVAMIMDEVKNWIEDTVATLPMPYSDQV